ASEPAGGNRMPKFICYSNRAVPRKKSLALTPASCLSKHMEFYRWRPHPWHGLDPGSKAPELVEAYLEITPFDSMK
ncbi:MAG: hypothetical protein R6U56_05780, partial [Opitutales bacterium]